MSVYFVFSTKNTPQNLNIVLPSKTISLQQLNEKFVPEFYIEMTNKNFYFLDGEINFKHLENTIDICSISDGFKLRFQEERNALFRGLLKWLSAEILLGNSIYLIRQIETDDKDEGIEFNSIYVSQDFSLSAFHDSDDVNFDFNIAYRILE